MAGEFEVADGTSFLWLNEKKLTPQHPDYFGEMQYKGQKLKFALWQKMTRTNKGYFILKIDDDSWKNKQEYPREVGQRADEDVPF